MLETLLNLIGITLDNYNIDDNLLFVVLSFFVLYCLGYVFNLLQRLLDRCTSRGVRSS